MNKPKGLSCAHLFNKVVRAVTKAWNMESFWLYPAIFDIRIAFHVEKLWGFMTCRFWRQACMLVEVRPNCWRVEGVGRWKLKNRQRKRHRSCEYKQTNTTATVNTLDPVFSIFIYLQQSKVGKPVRLTWLLHSQAWTMGSLMEKTCNKSH